MPGLEIEFSDYFVNSENSIYSPESKFLPLFVVLFYMTLLGAKIVITHMTICRIILKLFTAA
jgi:hypothetical protein